jgi:hypothetical protein
MSTTKTTGTHTGTCHCGAAKFEVTLEPSPRVSRCNCSICRRTSQLGTIVKPAAFTLVAGEANLASYAGRNGVAHRFFCTTCGIHVFGRGHLEQLGGDFVSVNLNCVDELEVNEKDVVYWDGRHDNWMAGPRSTPWPVSAA